MEMTLNMGTFEALDQQELSSVDGGNLYVKAVLYGSLGVIYDLYKLGYSNGYNSVIYGG